MIATGLQTIYLLVWSYALCSLFAKFRACKTLLPRRRVFVTHAILLAIFVLAQIIYITLLQVIKSPDCGQTCEKICWDINLLLAIIGNTSEVTTFAYVVFSQISFTGGQKGRREALKNVLLCGFTSIEDVERAVLE